ncbi:MAG: hypothetical protein IT452_20290 [Planctomycetia bacterium]|nr:hypothetical protein [Planctomycetia bacterium]
MLAKCEQDLRALLAEAANAGEYSSLHLLTNCARAVASLGPQLQQNSVVPEKLEQPRETSEECSVTDGHPNSREGVRIARSRYPRFFRRGQELVKVGWSKRDRREYHHRAPWSSIEAVAEAVVRKGIGRKLFKGGDILAALEASGRGTVPDYQTYVALAWMKDLKLVVQRGRKAGYAVPETKTVKASLPEAWQQLPEWNG